MNKWIQYFLSVLVFIGVTLLALYFPGYYLDNYQYEARIEEVGEQEFPKIQEGSASAYKIQKMMQDGNYEEVVEYNDELEWADAAQYEESYAQLAEEVIKKYLLMEGIYYNENDAVMEIEVIENWAGEGILLECLMQWIEEKEDWRISKVKTYNASQMFDGKMYYAKLYEVRISNPRQDAQMRIVFDEKKKFMYKLNIVDERYELEAIEEDGCKKYFIEGYWYGEHLSTLDKEINKMIDEISVVTAPGVFQIGW